MSGRLAGRRALVTGASGGLGSAIAVGLAREGASVAVHARRSDAGARVVERIRSTGGTAVLVGGDVADPDQASEMVREAGEHLGGLDVLVNNAGIMSTTSFLDLRADEWAAVIHTNLFGYFLVGQAAAKVMVGSGERGAIVNVSSTRQVQAWPGSAAYATSKGGIAMLTRSMALELAPLGIRVNSIAPGTFVTDLNRHYLTEPEFQQQRVATIPAGRYGETDEVVGAVVYLVSDEASFVIGASLAVDGGQTIW